MKGSKRNTESSTAGATRRQFLRRAGALAAGAAMARLLGPAATAHAADTPATLPAIGTLPSTGPIDASAKSIVAHLQHDEVISGALTQDNLLRDMIEDGVKAVTGAKSAGDGWNRLLKSDDVIGIKFNHVGSDELQTTPAFATQLVASLGQAGFAPERIMLIEVPTPLARALKTRRQVFGFSGPAVSFASGEEELSAVLQEVTAIINVPFLKTHNIAGMTGCLKNLSHALIRRPGKYHANGCAPYVGDIVALPAIRSKLRLHVMNALRAVYRGGPAVDPDNMWTHAGILVSTDPVATDAVGLDLINAQRAEVELPPLGDEDGHIAHVHAAADRGLGTDDQDYIRVVMPEPV